MRSATTSIARWLLLLPPLLTGPGGPRASGDTPPAARRREPVTEPVSRGSLFKQQDGDFRCLAFSPDGKTLAAGPHNVAGIRLYDPMTDRERSTFATKDTTSNSVSVMTYSPDGQTIAVGPTRAGGAALVDAATGSLRVALEKPPSIGDHTFPTSLAYSPDGKAVACGYLSGEVVLWDAATGHRRAILPASLVPPNTGPSRADVPLPVGVYDLTFTPEGAALLWFGRGGPLRACAAADGAERTPPIKIDRPADLIRSPDGQSLAVTERTGDWLDDNRRVTLWDPATWHKRSEWVSRDVHNGPKALVSGGRTLAVLEDCRDLQLRDAADGHSLARLRFDTIEFYEYMAVSPDGRWLAIGGFCSQGFYGIIRMIEIDGKTLRPWKPRP